MQLKAKPIIIFLGFLVAAAFEKFECDSCVPMDFFPFADWRMLWSTYAERTGIFIVFMAFSYVIYREERTLWSLVSFSLVMGWYVNFALRANARFFTVYGYPFGYTAFAALIFFLCVLIQTMNGFSRFRS